MHLKEQIPAGYPFTTPGSRETVVDKMPCLRAYAPSGIQTHDPLITSREQEPLHHSATFKLFFIIISSSSDLAIAWSGPLPGLAGGEFFFPKQVYLLLRESDLHQDHRYQT